MSPDPPSHAHPTFKPLLPPRLAVSEVTSVIVVTSEVSPSVPAATPASNDKKRKENQIETGFFDECSITQTIFYFITQIGIKSKIDLLYTFIESRLQI
jgi:hypothetical protein